MSYEIAVKKAWDSVAGLTDKERFSQRLLSDTYDIILPERRVLSLSCNAPAKDYTVIILLHYLAKKLGGSKIPDNTGEWIDFNTLEGGEAYYPAFKKRTLDRLITKYGRSPEELLTAASRMNAESSLTPDVSIIVRPFDEIAILIKMFRADEEFGPDANILFDSNISKIFCTEDVVVITEMIVHQL